MFQFNFLQQTALEQETKKRLEDIVQLLDWMAKIEHALGSEQPMTEQSTQLDQQTREHKVRLTAPCGSFIAYLLILRH